MFATRADLPAWVHQARPGALGHDLSGPGYHSGEAERDRPDPHTLRAVQLKVTEEDPPWTPPVPRSVLLPCPRVSRLQPVADLEMVCSGLPRGPPCLHGVTSRSPREPFSGEELLTPSSGPDRPHYPCGNLSRVPLTRRRAASWRPTAPRDAWKWGRGWWWWWLCWGRDSRLLFLRLLLKSTPWVWERAERTQKPKAL